MGVYLFRHSSVTVPKTGPPNNFPILSGMENLPFDYYYNR